MADVKVEVTGEMETPLDFPVTSSFSSYLQFPSQIPDPKEWILNQKQNVRSWFVFIQTSNFKTPPSVPRLGKRIMRNIEYFQANYLFVFLGLIIYCLITSPLILFALGATFYGGYRINKRHQEQKTVIFGKELTLAQQYGILWACSMPIYYMVGAHGAMFWVIGASFFIIGLHASFYNIEALVPKNEDGFPLLEEV